MARSSTATENPHFNKTVPGNIVRRDLQDRLEKFDLWDEGLLRPALMARLQMAYLAWIDPDQESEFEQWFKMSKDVLMYECKEKGLLVDGTVPDLRRRLVRDAQRKLMVGTTESLPDRLTSINLAAAAAAASAPMTERVSTHDSRVNPIKTKSPALNYREPSAAIEEDSDSDSDSDSDTESFGTASAAAPPTRRVSIQDENTNENTNKEGKGVDKHAAQQILTFASSPPHPLPSHSHTAAHPNQYSSSLRRRRRRRQTHSPSPRIPTPTPTPTIIPPPNTESNISDLEDQINLAVNMIAKVMHDLRGSLLHNKNINTSIPATAAAGELEQMPKILAAKLKVLTVICENL